MNVNKVEIVANNSIQADVFDGLKMLGLDKRYTLIRDVEGFGSNGGRLGSTIWPELNFILILYLDDEQTKAVSRCCKKIKEHFPNEGLKMISWKVDILA